MNETLSTSPPQRRGRPPAKEPGTALSTWVPASQYDRLCKIAAQHDMTVSRLVRQVLIVCLGPRT
jgi:hypothetical protein